MVEVYLHSPYVFMTLCLIKHRDNFTLPIPISTLHFHKFPAVVRRLQTGPRRFIKSWQTFCRTCALWSNIWPQTDQARRRIWGILFRISTGISWLSFFYVSWVSSDRSRFRTSSRPGQRTSIPFPTATIINHPIWPTYWHCRKSPTKNHFPAIPLAGTCKLLEVKSALYAFWSTFQLVVLTMVYYTKELLGFRTLSIARYSENLARFVA
jgi:hypothetical protein